ncbi:hypothetical protein Poli38472_010281 [Pythium oligandrum]|uniref:Uncharacterized protein n=1 Tax=Pythium oligandrum TaxID=41045 RepID=A0A8K1CA49_PYTOL|nr:hypothetical protein Poli38472_010281 [Pythium oligandrum]|eukprot:TMW58722.1 hypothetical protein Poli38472_010281 [Pythium oligandrum]
MRPIRLPREAQLCAFRHPVLWRLLLDHNIYAAITPLKLNLTEVILEVPDDQIPLAVLDSLVQRRQLNRIEKVRALCCALHRQRNRVVERLLRLKTVEECHHRWLRELLVAASGYSDHNVSLSIITTLLQSNTVEQFAQPQRSCTPLLPPRVTSSESTKSPIQRAANAAGARGNLKVLGKLLATSDHIDLHLVLCFANEKCQLETVRYILALDYFGAGKPSTEFSSVLFAAVSGGDLVIVRLILTDARVNTWDPLALHQAAQSGNMEAMELLLQHPDLRQGDLEGAFRTAVRVEQSPQSHISSVLSKLLVLLYPPPTPHPWEVLDILSAYGDVQLVNFVLKCLDNCDAEYWRPLNSAARNGHVAIVKTLVSRLTFAEGEAGEALVSACYHDHVEVVDLLTPLVSTSLIQQLRVLEAAAATAQGTKVLDWFIRSHPEVLKACDADAALQYACAHGRTNAARLLLACPFVHFSDGLTLHFAASSGVLELVELLLSDPRVDETYDLEAALEDAARDGHIDIVRRLLVDPRLRLTSGSVIHQAARRGRADIVRMLLNDPGFMRDENREMLRLDIAHLNALRSDHYETIWTILRDERVPLVLNGSIARLADLPRERGDTKWTAFLRRYLRHPRMNPAAEDNYLLLRACQDGRRGVVHALLQTQRCDDAILNGSALRAVEENLAVLATRDITTLSRHAKNEHQQLEQRYQRLRQDLGTYHEQLRQKNH